MPGQLADLAVLSADYFSVPDEEIKRSGIRADRLSAVKPVYGAEEFGRSGAASAAGAAGLVSGRGVWRLSLSRFSGAGRHARSCHRTFA